MNKITNIKDLQYYGNMEFLCQVVLDALKKNKTERLDKMAQSLNEITFYVNELQTNRWAYDKALSEYREDKNRAVERARQAEEKIEKLEEELKKFNIFNTNK